MITRGKWGSRPPDYSAYTAQNAQRALAAACHARKLSSCRSKLQLGRRLSASGVPPQLVRKVAEEPDWREGRAEKQLRVQKEDAIECEASEGVAADGMEGPYVPLQTAEEDDEKQTPQLESQILIPETPRCSMP